MEEKENFIEIRDLYVNFYTKAGVVKAIDGVDMEIKKGETFGLVGESGCGKSVTANCIMRLIPSPPGKIEKGEINVLYPEGIQDSLLHYVLDQFKKESNIDLGKDKKAMSKVRQACFKAMEELKAGNSTEVYLPQITSGKSGTRDLRVKLDHELLAHMSVQDVMKMSSYQLRKIRGKRISMIFQEPMSALNPVFTAGDQIAEVFLLHERNDLIHAVINRTDEQIKRLEKEGFQTGKTETETGEIKCSDCGTTVNDGQKKCPTCGGRFDRSRMKALQLSSLRRQKKTYQKMLKDPNSFEFIFKDFIPVLKNYKRPLNAEAKARAVRMLRLVRIPDPGSIVNSYPHELSGGMQQRVMIAMALACRPQLLIADEPTTALDVTIQAQILKLMRELQEQTGTSILMITHNLGVVAEMCDRVGVMYAGNIVEVGSTDSVFEEPMHPYTQGLINSIPKLNVNLTRLDIIEGSVPNLLKPPAGCRFHPRCPYAMGKCTEEKPVMKEVRPNHFVACHLFGEVKSDG